MRSPPRTFGPWQRSWIERPPKASFCRRHGSTTCLACRSLRCGFYVSPGPRGLTFTARFPRGATRRIVCSTGSRPVTSRAQTMRQMAPPPHADNRLLGTKCRAAARCSGASTATRDTRPSDALSGFALRAAPGQVARQPLNSVRLVPAKPEALHTIGAPPGDFYFSSHRR